ncbi:MAG: S1C family serine protease [Magnetovibrionaceae bacterium]
MLRRTLLSLFTLAGILGLGLLIGMANPAAAQQYKTHAQDPRATQEAHVKPKLEQIVRSVVTVRSVIKSDARTALSLGLEREGSGVLLDESGLVLTIGYLVMEAAQVEVLDSFGKRHPAKMVAYDHDSGFGLVQTENPLDLPIARLGDSGGLAEGSPAMAVSLIGDKPLTPTRVVSKRSFAGYWEYLLDEAIYTSPPHMAYGGAALFDGRGRLIGIGSLFVNDAIESDQMVPGNMFVPIDVLKPILAQLKTVGRQTGPARPWLGLYPTDANGRVYITRLASDGPAEAAGMLPGDIVVGVEGRRVADMSDFYRKVWAAGEAGDAITLDVVRPSSGELTINQIKVSSSSRYDWLKLD